MSRWAPCAWLVLLPCCLVLVLSSAGCSSPNQRFDAAARETGLTRWEVRGLGFHHAVFGSRDSYSEGGPVHVYLAGDGTPYVRRTLRSADPTPRRPAVLDLMAMDPAPRLLLGRPCYHGLAGTKGCGSDLWTQARYGEQVVGSMAAALRRVVPQDAPLVLIGFSGGGTLAVLLAPRLSNVAGIVTLAGNLDIDAWTDLHGYSPLSGSRNPAGGGALPIRVRQLHLAGSSDRVVPPTLTRPVAVRLGGRLRLMADTTHERGWRRHWPGILDEIDQWAPSAAAR